PLVLDYDWRPLAELRDVVLPGLMLCALLAGTMWGVLRRAPAAFAGAWWFLILAPSSSVIPIVTEVAAEHRVYLPLAGAIVLVVLGVYETGRRLAGTNLSLRRGLARAGVVAAA